jgi:hypothetical protein
MQVANQHLERLLEELVEKLMDDQRAWTREKSAERTRARLAPQQSTLAGPKPPRVAKKKGKEHKKDTFYAEGGYVVAPSLHDDEDPDSTAHDPDRGH